MSKVSVILWAAMGAGVLWLLISTVYGVVHGTPTLPMPRPIEYVYESGVRCYTWAQAVSCVK